MPSKKDKLLNYLNSVDLEVGEPSFMTQEEINSSSSSYLINRDFSKYKDYLTSSGSVIHDSPDTWDDLRARQQSGLTKFGNSVGQMAGTFTTALASTVASLGSGVAALGAEAITGGEAQGMDIFLNNPIMQGIDQFDKYLKEDLLPTYYTKEQQESIFSAATGTDLLNGVGFLASNLLPNAFIMKQFGGLSKMAAVAKAGKLTGVLDDAVKAGKLTNVESQVLSKTARYLDKVGPVTGALVGRLGESAIESYGTYDQIKQSLEAENQIAEQELAMYGTTDKTIRTPEEIEAEAKRGRDNVFKGNMFLAASDFLQAGRWLGGKGLVDNLIKEGLKTTVKKQTKAELLGKLIAEGAQEAAEEGYQFLLSKGAEKSASGKSFLEGVSEASGELFSTSEGLKSMLIGAVLGGGMSGIVDVRNAKKNKQILKDWADQLTANADVKQRFIETPEGKMVVNPELTKIATTFAAYEQQKQQALANNDNDAYELAEKMQFSELVSAKLDTGTYDDFIDELKALSTARPEEVKAMFGSLPVKDGKEMSPSQVIAEKVALAERVKNLQEGLSKLPQVQQLGKGGLNLLRFSLFTQENLRDQVQELDNKIAQIKSKAVTEYDAKTRQITENKLLPFDQQELDQLTKDREVVFDEFAKVSKQFADFVATPEKAQKQADKAQNDIIEQVVNETESKIINDEKAVENARKNGEFININSIDHIIIEDLPNGNYLLENPETNEQIEVTKEDIVNALPEEEEDTLPEEEIETTGDIPSTEEIKTEEDSDLKVSLLSTTGTALQMEDGKDVIEEGEKVLNPEFKKQTEIFNEPSNTPNVSKTSKGKPPVITFKAEIGRLTDKQIENTNQRRVQKGLPKLERKDFENNTDYTPIKLTMYINGEEQPVTNMFHNPEYYYSTAIYDQIEKDDSLNAAQKKAKHQENIDKFKSVRNTLVTTIKDKGPVTLTATDKSAGVLNFNPLVEGTKKTSPVLEVFEEQSIDEFLKPKKLPLYINGQQVKTKGLVVVKEVVPVEGQSEETYLVTYIDTNFTEVKQTLNYAPEVGTMIYDVVMANGSIKPLEIFNKQSFSPEQIENITQLLLYKLTESPTIEIEGTTLPIVGNSTNPGIVDSLIYVGKVKSKEQLAINSQLVFTKDGMLVLGKEKISKEDPEAYNKIKSHLNNYKRKPQFKINSLTFESFGIPTKTDKGWTIKNPVSYAEFMFGGKNPLIQTSLNKTKYTNSYYIFATDNGGNLLMNYKVQPTPTTPVSDKKAGIERLSNKTLTSAQGTINTGKLEEAILPTTVIEESIAQDKDGNWIEVYINNPKLQGTLLARNGKYLFRAMQGRFFVIAKVGNFYLPFYISSSGTSGKNEGEWYPFFGYNNWLVKGSVGKKGEMEYSEKISEVQKLLNNNFIIPAKYFTQFGQITNGKGTPLNPDKVFYDINTHVKYESWFVDFDRQKDNKYTEEEFVADRTGLNPKNVVNDGKGSADSWIRDVVALTEDAEKSSKGIIPNAELAALEGKPVTEVKTSQQEIEKLKEKQRKELGFDYDNLKVGDSFDVKYNWADNFETLTLFAKSKDGRAWLIGKTKAEAKWKNLKDFRGDTLKYTQEKINEINARYEKQIQELTKKPTQPAINPAIEQKEKECKGQTSKPGALNLDNLDSFLPDLD